MLSHESLYAVSSAMHPALPTDSCLESRYLRAGDPVPSPGSVVHYAHPVTEIIYVARIVAHEGQTVQMVEGHLHIDGAPVRMDAVAPYVELMESASAGHLPRCPSPTAEGETCEIPQFHETLPNGVTYRVLNIHDGSSFDDTEVFTVPEGHVFVLGDNRDNSVDSRVPQYAGGVGMVPVQNIRGVIDQPATARD